MSEPDPRTYDPEVHETALQAKTAVRELRDLTAHVYADLQAQLVVIESGEMPSVDSAITFERTQLAAHDKSIELGKLVRRMTALSKDHYTPVITDEDAAYDLAEEAWKREREESAA